MPNIDGTLKSTERAMTPEEWEVNKSCAAAHRDHKWQWLGPGNDSAICVHCGEEMKLSRRVIGDADGHP